jgi:membrane protein involved in colicin uptake
MPGQDCQDRTVRTGLPAQAAHRTATIRYPGQDRKNRIARKGQPARDSQNGKAEQDRQNRKDRMRQAEQERQKGEEEQERQKVTGRTGFFTVPFGRQYVL